MTVGDKERHRHFGIVLKECDLSPFMIQETILMLTEPIDHLVGVEGESLPDMEGRFAVENGRLELAAFFFQDLVTGRIFKTDGACGDGDGCPDKGSGEDDMAVVAMDIPAGGRVGSIDGDQTVMGPGSGAG